MLASSIVSNARLSTARETQQPFPIPSIPCHAMPTHTRAHFISGEGEAILFYVTKLKLLYIITKNISPFTCARRIARILTDQRTMTTNDGHTQSFAHLFLRQRTIQPTTLLSFSSLSPPSSPPFLPFPSFPPPESSPLTADARYPTLVEGESPLNTVAELVGVNITLHNITYNIT